MTDISFGRFNLHIPSKVLKASSKDDTFTIAYSYEKDKEHGLKQVVSAVSLSTNEKTDDYHYFIALHEVRPPEGCAKPVIDNWLQIHNKAVPYDGMPYNDGQNTNCNIIYNITNESFDWINLEIQGASRNEDMIDFQNAIKKSLGIKKSGIKKTLGSL